MLAKQTYVYKSVSDSVARTGVLVLVEGRRSGTFREVCIKEYETDCIRLVVQYVKKNEIVRKVD